MSLCELWGDDNKRNFPVEEIEGGVLILILRFCGEDIHEVVWKLSNLDHGWSAEQIFEPLRKSC